MIAVRYIRSVQMKERTVLKNGDRMDSTQLSFNFFNWTFLVELQNNPVTIMSFSKYIEDVNHTLSIPENSGYHYFCQ